MVFTSKRQKYAKIGVSVALFLILAIAYRFMFYLQEGFAHANDFEDIDCTLFHLSLPSHHYFEL